MNGFSSVGLGGGGAMFAPAISPHDPNLLFVGCDMGGVYRSADGGESWTMIVVITLFFSSTGVINSAQNEVT